MQAPTSGDASAISIRFCRTIVFAKDMNKMSAFYCDVLGMVPRPDRYPFPADEFLDFDVGTVKFALHAIPGGAAARVKVSDPPVPRHGVPTKLVFQADDVTEARDALLSRNVTLIDDKFCNEPGEYVRCDFLDPEGNIFQLTQENV